MIIIQMIMREKTKWREQQIEKKTDFKDYEDYQHYNGHDKYDDNSNYDDLEQYPNKVPNDVWRKWKKICSYSQVCGNRVWVGNFSRGQ